MFNSKVNHMTVIVKGVRDDDYEGREPVSYTHLTLPTTPYV